MDAQRRSVEHQARDLGAAITYWVFFSIFPMLIGMIALAGFFLDTARAQQLVFDILNEVLPASALEIEAQIGAIVDARGALGTIGIATLLWSGSAGLGAITRAVNRAWGSHDQYPNWFARLRTFVMMIGLALLLVVSVGLTAVVEVLHQRGLLEPLEPLGLEAGTIDRVQGYTFSFVCVFMMFALIYRMTPSIKVTWRQALPGALLATAMFGVAQIGFLIYLNRFADHSIYGSLASIIVSMLWLYAVARLLIYCAEFNVALDARRVASTDTEAAAAEIQAS